MEEAGDTAQVQNLDYSDASSADSEAKLQLLLQQCVLEAKAREETLRGQPEPLDVPSEDISALQGHQAASNQSAVDTAPTILTAHTGAPGHQPAPFPHSLEPSVEGDNRQVPLHQTFGSAHPLTPQPLQRLTPAGSTISATNKLRMIVQTAHVVHVGSALVPVLGGALLLGGPCTPLALALLRKSGLRLCEAQEAPDAITSPVGWTADGELFIGARPSVFLPLVAFLHELWTLLFPLTTLKATSSSSPDLSASLPPTATPGTVPALAGRGQVPTAQVDTLQASYKASQQDLLMKAISPQDMFYLERLVQVLGLADLVFGTQLPSWSWLHRMLDSCATDGDRDSQQPQAASNLQPQQHHHSTGATSSLKAAGPQHQPPAQHPSESHTTGPLPGSMNMYALMARLQHPPQH